MTTLNKVDKSRKGIIKTIIISILVANLAYFYIDNWFFTRQFVNQGSRFTGKNGQELCLRIKHLEFLVDPTINNNCNY